MAFKDDITTIKDSTNTALTEADEFVIQGKLQGQAGLGNETLTIDKAEMTIMDIDAMVDYIKTLGWTEVTQDRDTVTVTI